MVELLIVIGVIAILSAIVLPVYSGLTSSTTASVARRNLNLLNGAVVAINNAKSQLEVTATADGADEQAIFAQLQATDPDAKGSPYLPAHLKGTTTSSTNKYRAVWNGTFFQILNPGAAGTGIDLLALGSSLGNTP